MIVRPQQHWFRRLFVWHGSVLPNILFRLSLNFAMALLAVYLLPWYEDSGIRLTLGPFSLLGVAIAIFLGFRNNTSYARFSEARHLWGSLLVTARSILRQLKSALPNEADARTFAGLLIAFAWCLKHQLRGTDCLPDLARLLPDPLFDEIAASPFPASRLLLRMGYWLGEKRRTGEISDIIYASVDRNLDELSHILGACERLASTPIPFAYSLILHRTVYLFCTCLPFALVEDLKYMTPLVSVFISYTFLSLESVAEELEDPFGTAPNDLPLNAICTNIERQLREMNDLTPIPEMLLPDRKFNLT
ncbi:bestrophin family protein [Azonexus sp.]|uniref:bestrophin family protein n=1 Tax=Azonexus sp. TaxID=1872668 RepID=UPI0035B1F907